MVKCITCGSEFVATKNKANRPYKNCQECRKSLIGAGKSGGSMTKQRYGAGYYESIGKKGGGMVRELISDGKRAKK